MNTKTNNNKKPGLQDFSHAAPCVAISEMFSQALSQTDLFISKEYLCTQYPITIEGVSCDLTLKSLY